MQDIHAFVPFLSLRDFLDYTICFGQNVGQIWNSKKGDRWYITADPLFIAIAGKSISWIDHRYI